MFIQDLLYRSWEISSTEAKIQQETVCKYYTKRNRTLEVSEIMIYAVLVERSWAIEMFEAKLN